MSSGSALVFPAAPFCNTFSAVRILFGGSVAFPWSASCSLLCGLCMYASSLMPLRSACPNYSLTLYFWGLAQLRSVLLSPGCGTDSSSFGWPIAFLLLIGPWLGLDLFLPCLAEVPLFIGFYLCFGRVFVLGRLWSKPIRSLSRYGRLGNGSVSVFACRLCCLAVSCPPMLTSILMFIVIAFVLFLLWVIVCITLFLPRLEFGRVNSHLYSGVLP